MLDRVSAAWIEDRRLTKAIAGPDRVEFGFTHGVRF
jgi:hypothetical protein